MTESEAKEWLNLISGTFNEVDKRVEALDMAIKALEKQIAKKPIDKSKNPIDWHIMACPCCEHTFWNSGQFVRYQPKYCNYCGQKLDWK